MGVKAAVRAKVQTRPAETIAGTVGTAVGFLLVLAHVYWHWNLPRDLQPYVPVVVGWIAGIVTWVKVHDVVPRIVAWVQERLR